MRFMIFVLVVLFFTTSCKKNNENSICFTRTTTQLKIENNTNKIFYIASFGQNILPLIDWAPICGNNNVPPNSSISKELSSIAGYSDNDELVVYWWECEGSNPRTMHSVILDIDQTVCQ